VHQQAKSLRRRSDELRVFFFWGGGAETATNIPEYQFNVDFRGIESEEVTSQRGGDELPFCVAGGCVSLVLSLHQHPTKGECATLAS